MYGKENVGSFGMETFGGKETVAGGSEGFDGRGIGLNDGSVKSGVAGPG